MNQVCLVGRITRDLELRISQSNKKYVYFTVAVSDNFSRDKTNFIPCVAFEKTAENMCQYLHKGSLISVEGKITTSTMDNAGKKETKVNITVDRVNFLEPKNKSMVNNSNNYNHSTTNNINNTEIRENAFDDIIINDDDDSIFD